MKPLMIFLILIMSLRTWGNTDSLTIGGHVRFNADYKDWVDDSDRTRFEFESFRINVTGQTGPFTVRADYRFYENVDMTVLRYADVEYQWHDNWSVKLGITRVPFAKQAFLSNSFWYSINYYLGFEDDNDAGLVLNYRMKDWSISGGYFFNDEYNKPASFERYSFDVADDGTLRNKENGQWNLHLEHSWSHDTNQTTTASISLQQGDILDLTTLEHNTHKAFSAHIQHTRGAVDLVAQYIDYEYQVTQVSGQANDRIALSAFAYPFPIIREGHSWVFNAAYTFKNLGYRISSLTCYTEYGAVDSELATSKRSVQWVNGCMAAVDKFYIYLDTITGKNMWFAGGSGIGIDFNDHSSTTHRTNLSIGYYF